MVRVKGSTIFIYGVVLFLVLLPPLYIVFRLGGIENEIAVLQVQDARRHQGIQALVKTLDGAEHLAMEYLRILDPMLLDIFSTSMQTFYAETQSLQKSHIHGTDVDEDIKRLDVLAHDLHRDLVDISFKAGTVYGRYGLYEKIESHYDKLREHAEKLHHLALNEALLASERMFMKTYGRPHLIAPVSNGYYKWKERFTRLQQIASLIPASEEKKRLQQALKEYGVLVKRLDELLVSASRLTPHVGGDILSIRRLLGSLEERSRTTIAAATLSLKKQTTRYRILLAIGTFLVSGLLWLVLSMYLKKRRQNRLLKRLMHTEQVTLTSMREGLALMDADGVVQQVNPEMRRLLRLSDHEDLTGKPFHQCFRFRNRRTAEPIKGLSRRCRKNGETIRFEQPVEMRLNESMWLPVTGSLSPIMDNKDRIGMVLVIHDMSEQMRLMAELEYQSIHDDYTGLYNRRGFFTLVEALLHQGGEHALIFMDVDAFKLVNDTCGHEVGDRMLTQLVNLLKGRVRQDDILGRLGGDEFAILLKYCGRKQADKIADALCQLLAGETFTWGEKRFNFSCSLGLVHIRNPEQFSLQDLIRQADIACYHAKECGGSRVYVWDDNDPKLKNIQGSMDWVHRIRQSMQQQSLQLYAQKIVSLDENKGESIHYEVLSRMPGQLEGEVYTADQFIPIAERFNFIIDIDLWVTSQACKWLQENRGRLPDQDDPILSVNISAKSLTSSLFFEKIQQIIQE
ncbi:MAG: diguanylate cyclase, partial [Gammaproteobacteria bacterium]